MTNPEILGALSGVQAMLRDLVSGLPPAVANRPLDPQLHCPGWQLAQAVYRQTYWLREAIPGGPDLTNRVRYLFPAETAALAESNLAAACAQLPPPEHLIHWAAETQEGHLRRLATPGALPDHPLLAEDRLAWFLLQEAALSYARLLALKRLDAIDQNPAGYRVAQPLAARSPRRWPSG